MRSIIATILVLAAAMSANRAFAGVFDLPANGSWVQVQSGDTIQWSAIPASNPHMRIDLLSYVENGNRTTYYLVRSACSDGTVASSVIGSGHTIGIGEDCNGNTVEVSTVLDKVQKLPAAAAALLHQ